jgi:ApaG protein
MLTDKREDIYIKVSTRFEENQSNPEKNYFLFSYTIYIENKGEHPVQLLNRHWEISDSLHPKRIVDGVGVVGEQPILEKGQSFKYTSACDLYSEIGKMKGYYEFKDLLSDKQFKVQIPEFELVSLVKLN